MPQTINFNTRHFIDSGMTTSRYAAWVRDCPVEYAAVQSDSRGLPPSFPDALSQRLRREPRRCGICNMAGHNRRTCPYSDGDPAPSSEQHWRAEREHRQNVERIRRERERIYDETIAEVRSAIDRIQPPPPPPKRDTLPKHIAQVIAENTEATCQICLTDLDAETLCLSKCGHNFCDTCLNDTRLTQCGVCRADL